MKPTLFTLELFGRELPYYSYGALLALGFVLGIAVALYNSKRTGITREDVVNLSLAILVAALLGARLLQIVAADDPGADFTSGLAGGGFAFYGGFIAAVAVGIGYCRYKGIEFLAVADTMSPGIALGLASARLGCLLAGCCWGKPIEAPLPSWLPGDFDWPKGFATRFLHPDALAPKGVWLVPTELLMALSGLAIFLFLQFAVRPRSTWRGQVFAWFLVLYSVLRSTWELFRDDPRGLYFGETLSTSQLISIPIFVGGVILLVRKGHTRGGDDTGVDSAAHA